MSTKPTITKIQWDTTDTHSIDSTVGHRASGYISNEVPTSDEINGFFRQVWLWAQYLNDQVFSGDVEITGNLLVDGIASITGRAEKEIFVPVPEFVSAADDFAGTAKTLAITSLPVGSKITTIATVMKGDGTFGSLFTLFKYPATGSVVNLGGSSSTVEAASYHTTTPVTFNCTTMSGDAFTVGWAAVTSQHLRGFVVKYIPPAAL